MGSLRVPSSLDRRPLVLGFGRLAAVTMGIVSSAIVTTASATESSSAVWVFFRDKGSLGQGPARAAALLAREGQLPARTLERRKRARGDRGVDDRDLPLDSTYLARVEATGVKIRLESRWLNAVSVDATARQHAALIVLPEVARVEPVRQQPRASEPTRPAVSVPTMGGGGGELGSAAPQLQLIGADILQQSCGLTGAGVLVGVQDSGFDLEHQAFAGLNVVGSRDFIDDDDDVSEQPGDPVGQSEHGTLVMGTLAGSDPGTFMGVAPGIDVLLSKTERVDAEVPAEEDYFVAGLEWIESQGADIFTASLGYGDWYSPADFDGQTAVTSIAANIAFDNGLLVMTSAGNLGPDRSTLVAPADSFGALAVGASTQLGNVAGFSSRGPTADGRIKPDISAPGVEIISVEVGTQSNYAYWGGTSAAAPLAAGVAALILEARPELTAAELADLLRNTASQSAMPDNDLGWGIVNGPLASGDVCGCDIDNDGFIGTICGGDDCDDEEPLAAPGLEEICGDGIDNDCEDGDLACPSTTEGGPADGSGGADSGTPSSDDDGTPGGTADSDSTGGEPDAIDGAEGCGCRSDRPRSASGLALLLMGLGASRRRLHPRLRSQR